MSTVDILYGATPAGETTFAKHTVATYIILPIGQTDLFGATGLVTFMRGVTLLPINIIAAADDIPEVY